VNELDEIRQRLDSVEKKVDALIEGQAEGRRAADLFALVHRDMASLKVAFSAQRHLLQALRETQFDQGRAQAEHGQALGRIAVTLEAMHEAPRLMPGEMQATDGNARTGRQRR
jgi:hypothetical protein